MSYYKQSAIVVGIVAGLLSLGTIICIFAAIWVHGPNAGRIGWSGFFAGVLAGILWIVVAGLLETDTNITAERKRELENSRNKEIPVRLDTRRKSL